MAIRSGVKGFALVAVGMVVGGAVVWYAARPVRQAAGVHPTPRSSAHPKRRILYWASPMNPSIHSAHPMKDNMGMAYVPVYAKPPSAAGAPLKRRILYWANPMNASVHSDHPMKDGMGMAYVPVYAQSSSAGGALTGLSIDPRLAQNLGVRLVAVQRRAMGRMLHTVGTLTADRNRVYAVNPRFSGWVERLNVRAVGDPVQRGQVLARIYAPRLYSAEQEYLIAQRDVGVRDEGLQAAGRARLRQLGLSGAAIAALKGLRRAPHEVSVIAPVSGVVQALTVHQGGYISPHQDLMQIANLQRVWVNVAIYSYDLPWIRMGDRVRLHLPAYPGRVWRGKLSFLYPTLNSRSRTVTARLSFATPHGRLKPGMYADATIVTHPHIAFAVPNSAVLRTQNGDYVMLSQGHGHFLPVQVALGPETDGFTAIDRGVSAGEQVVDNAQFLLYSESQFQSVKARMLPQRRGPKAAQKSSGATGSMAGMDMGSGGSSQ